jgi:GT2 family glycosyltransferase
MRPVITTLWTGLVSVIRRSAGKRCRRRWPKAPIIQDPEARWYLRIVSRIADPGARHAPGTATRSPTVSVVIPSYRRPERLAACLHGLSLSDRAPDEVIVVLRSDDTESEQVVRAAAGRVNVVCVAVPGVLAAMSEGMRAAAGEVIAFLDDDAVPRVDWLGRILAHLEDPAVGAAGGRDVISEPDIGVRKSDAGRLTKWGRVVGNHHLVTGPSRYVDILKGANMAFRAQALALPRDLLGQGAQVHYEIATCLWARNHGWRLVLDPAAEVLHLPGERFGGDRLHPTLRAAHREAFNLTLAVLSMRPELALRRVCFGVLIGDRASPGVARTLSAIAHREPGVTRRFLPSITGQLRAIAIWARRGGVRMDALVDARPGLRR